MSPPKSRAGSSGGCPVEEVFRLLGKPYVLAILNSFGDKPGPQRFIRLQRQLGLSPNTLTQRLRELVDAGLLYRVPYHEIPPRVDYELTGKAQELRVIFEELHAWSKRNDLNPLPNLSQSSASQAARA